MIKFNTKKQLIEYAEKERLHEDIEVYGSQESMFKDNDLHNRRGTRPPLMLLLSFDF